MAPRPSRSAGRDWSRCLGWPGHPLLVFVVVHLRCHREPHKVCKESDANSELASVLGRGDCEAAGDLGVHRLHVEVPILLHVRAG